jgi:catechol 2,3-dioxygenase-like lactoylglutathione lyase family enzyme
LPEELEHLVSLYDRRAISRRQLLQGLVVLGIAPHLGRNSGAAETAAPGESIFRTRTINHVTLVTADVPRSKAFYQSLTGLPIRAEDKDFCEFRVQDGFLGLYAPEAGQKPGFDHFCFGIEHYDPEGALAALKAAMPEAQPAMEGDQVYLRDPDGVRVQIADVNYKR